MMMNGITPRKIHALVFTCSYSCHLKKRKGLGNKIHQEKKPIGLGIQVKGEAEGQGRNAAEENFARNENQENEKFFKMLKASANWAI